MIHTVAEVALEVLEATVPVLLLIFFFQLVVLRRRPANVRTLLLGTAMAVLGLFLFILGAKISLIPMGMRIGEFLAGVHFLVLVLFVFVLGVAVATAEPAVRIFAYEVDQVSTGSMRRRLVIATVALGVGLALSLAVARIEAGWALASILIPGYVVVLILTAVAPRGYVPVAFDAGAVATGPVAVNFVLPLSTGLAIGLHGETAGLLGFGVVGIIALVPILGMLLLGIVLDRGKNRA
jgi:hypothetical protein